MEDQTAVTLVLAQERNLIADAELYVLGNVTVGLGEGLKIKIIPDTVLYGATCKSSFVATSDFPARNIGSCISSLWQMESCSS